MIKDPRMRFEFGANWMRFLQVLDDQRIQEAERCLRTSLMVERLDGKRFLDVGSGSGLSSLVSRKLGATVHSFDFDKKSVACTAELRRRYFPDDPHWVVEQGSALDSTYVKSLGEFDVVYSWGVLHHTGAMWVAIENTLSAVKPGGLLLLALYNDQGWWSRVWWLIKYVCVKLPRWLQIPYSFTIYFLILALSVVKNLLLLRFRSAFLPLKKLWKAKPARGMNVWHDILDWMGGMPFEFVGYDVVTEYMRLRKFQLIGGTPNPGLGCHEHVFLREPSSVSTDPAIRAES